MGRWDGLHRPQSTWLAEFTGCRSQRGFTWFTFGWFSWCLFYFFYSIFYSVYLLLFLNFILNCFGFMKNFPFPSGSKRWTKTDTGNGNDDVRNHVTSICATYCLSQLIHSKYLLCSSHGWRRTFAPLVLQNSWKSAGEKGSEVTLAPLKVPALVFPPQSLTSGQKMWRQSVKSCRTEEENTSCQVRNNKK